MQNRALPHELATWSARTPSSPEGRAFMRYVGNRVRLEERARQRLVGDHAHVLRIAEAAGLDTADRLAQLAALGEPLRAALGVGRAGGQLDRR